LNAHEKAVLTLETQIDATGLLEASYKEAADDEEHDRDGRLPSDQPSTKEHSTPALTGSLKGLHNALAREHPRWGRAEKNRRQARKEDRESHDCSVGPELDSHRHWKGDGGGVRRQIRYPDPQSASDSGQHQALGEELSE